jgi:hypothetical protein
MKHKVTVYLTDEELAELRKEARRRRLSLSRYMTERLDSAQDYPGGGVGALSAGELSPATEERLIENLRKAVGTRADVVAERLQTLIVMLDQFALSMLISTPEIGDSKKEQALAAGERRHHGWRRAVQARLDEQVQAGVNGAAAGNGVHA